MRRQVTAVLDECLSPACRDRTRLIGRLYQFLLHLREKISKIIKETYKQHHFNMDEEQKNLKIVLDLSPSTGDSDELFIKLGQYNRTRYRPYQDPKSYSFFIKDGQSLLGGAIGKIWIGAIYIERLFLSPHLRGQGYGKQIIEEIEKLGAQHNASTMVVENLCFQDSLNFYLKLGFSIAFKEKFYDDVIIYHLRKKIS